MASLADIVREFGPAYQDQFKGGILPSHEKALCDIGQCHTEALGGHLYHCEECGHEHYQYHSCRNRACPSCQGEARENWVDARLKDILPCPYFHLVFTVPEELNWVIRSNQKLLLKALMQAAGMSLLKLALDPKLLGGKIGALAILHTWGSTLGYHPHVHCLVPGGAYLKDTRIWQASNDSFFLPVKALSRVFRGMFLEALSGLIPNSEIPVGLYNHDWVVFCKATVQGPEKVIEYLSRYIYRTAISNGRIRKVENGLVTFEYKDYHDGKKKLMTLPGVEFLRRFLQHVLPSGFHRVRYFGLFSPACKAEFRSLQTALWNRSGRLFPEKRARVEKVLVCPRCQSQKLRLVGVFRRGTRAPPRSKPMVLPALTGKNSNAGVHASN